MTGDWQPISTAPLDGTPVLLCRGINADGGVVDWVSNPILGTVFVQVATWDAEEDVWFVYCDTSVDLYLHFEPTHWQALPKPPKVST